MITSLRLKHFKSWKDTGEMRLAPLTALFGSNSSGKTSLLQWMLLLKQTIESSDRNQALHLGDDRSAADMGTFQDLIFQHNEQNCMQWDMSWNLLEPLSIDFPEHQPPAITGQKMSYEAELQWKTNKIVVNKLEYRFSDKSFGMKAEAGNNAEYDLYADNFSFVRSRGRAWRLPQPVKCYGFPDHVRAYYQNAAFLSDFELELEKLFSRIYYLGPLRDHPKRQYTWAGSKPGDMGSRGERVVDAILAAGESGSYISPGHRRKRLTLEVRIATWLKQLQLVDSFEVRRVAEGSKLFQVWVRRSSDSPEVLLTDVGFGVSQILPVIALCYYVPEHSIIILEQPEIHLHPRVQAGLADVFVDAIQNRHVQIILESHSEHLLRRLQRRMAEETFEAHQAALYFCKNEKGTSSLEQLKIDAFGRIENWPPDFFGDEFGDIAEMSKAILQRKKRAS